MLGGILTVRWNSLFFLQMTSYDVALLPLNCTAPNYTFYIEYPPYYEKNRKCLSLTLASYQHFSDTENRLIRVPHSPSGCFCPFPYYEFCVFKHFPSIVLFQIWFHYKCNNVTFDLAITRYLSKFQDRDLANSKFRGLRTKIFFSINTRYI